jgi:hypothetical protein
MKVQTTVIYFTVLLKPLEDGGDYIYHLLLT